MASRSGRGGAGRSSARTARALTVVQKAVITCQRCPELRAYCADVAEKKRHAYRDWTYWGRPVPGFGDPAAKFMIVGLAPAAHGANRTGRMFTGDRSGDFLYAALHRAGFANQPHSTDRDDGLTLRGVYITAPLRCAPPANRPTAGQLAHCASYLHEELRVLAPHVILCLGAIGWKATLGTLQTLGATIPRPRPPFGHGATATIEMDTEKGRPAATTLLASYHVSQQNTFTGRLTEPMFDAVLEQARGLVT